MTNRDIAEKIYNSYYKVTSVNDKNTAKKHANALIDAQIQMMYQDEGTLIVDTDKNMFAEDWEEVKYIINVEL